MRTVTTSLFLLAMTTACSEAERPAPPTNSAEAAAPAAVASSPPLVVNAAASDVKWSPCPPVFSKPGCEMTVVHGDPASPNADVLLRVPGGYAIPNHRHTSAERMILVSGEMQVHYQGTPAATLKTGNYAYGPAGLPHEANCLSTEPCTLFIAFEGPVDAVAVEGPVS